MKRKLDQHDAPTVEVASPEPKAANTFPSFGVDPRLLQAVAKAQFTIPTAVQAQAIPPALDGKDVLAKSKTGSGKTLAYILPTAHSVLRRKATSTKSATTSVLVLVPTRELAEQVHKAYQTYCAFCLKDVRSVNITQRVSDSVLQAILQDSPDVIISTPGRVCTLLSGGSLKLTDITNLVIDEADLIMSYGYEDDIETISKAIPGGVKTFLCSATLTPELERLQSTFCKDPVIVKIADKEDQVEDLTQYVVKCAEDEKFLLVYVIFKLRLVRGKCIIFVEDIDRCYRVRLYLAQFGIKGCVLNSELPVNSRLHVVEEFNKGMYDILIAADDQEVVGGVSKGKATRVVAEDDGEESRAATDHIGSDEEGEDETRKQKQNLKGKDYGVSRGIDFQNVSCVLNFDLPHTSKSYTHRIGRTARAGKSGMALSFVVPREKFGKHKPTTVNSARHDEKVLEKIVARQAKKGKEVKDYRFDMAQVEGFRYRMNDALRAVTGVAVRQARAKEIKQELVKSEKLRKHFEEYPEDLRHLRHDAEHGVVRAQHHLKHVPDYLLPAKGRQGASVEAAGFVGFKKETENKRRKLSQQRKHGKAFGGSKKVGKIDPLKSFRAKAK